MRRKIGAEYLGNDKTQFTIWAPFKDKLEVIIKDGPVINLPKSSNGYWVGEIKETPPAHYINSE